MSVIKELVDAFCEELLDVQRLLVESEEQCRKVTKERDSMADELDQLRARNGQLQVDTHFATQSADDLRSAAYELRFEKKALQEDLDLYRSERDAAQDELESVRTAAAETERKLRDQLDRLEAMYEARIEQLKQADTHH